ncbi:unconventional myosin-Vb-like isoform X2 [Corticium candelabrum]|nr:unconventional myosin-Vb-like isoform X2 [Corticium candelabrum]
MQQQAIYTYCGIVLVAVNPYHLLPIYGADVIDAYRGQQMGQMDPHIFAVAEEAFRKMARQGKNQSIIVSGESGAGKTESAKYTMRYFASVGGAAADTQIEKKVLASNPIMEAIGNAKTIRNDNSSRFGKYIQIDFDRNQHIIGANMRTYLLEKSRVVFQADGERNYHIFYQLCASRKQSQLQGLKLAAATDFVYTRQGDCFELDGVDDSVQFEGTCAALSLLNVPSDQQRAIFRVLAAILHMGNVVFMVKNRRSDDASVKSDSASLLTCASLLGVDTAMLMKWLCNRKIITAKETYVKPLTVEQAQGARDGLAKHLYAQLFNWIVIQVNKTLTSTLRKTSFIGVLDIYGFETFEVNSFEQFCINYANEKLQQQFTQHVFKLEQEEYTSEKIEWSFIDFYDNQPCINLIESKLGVLDLLDEECKMPKGSDKGWLQKLYRNLENHSHFSKPRLSNTAFIISHFADMVEYESDGFLEKNKDAIVQEHIALLKASEHELVGELFEDQTKKKQSKPGHLHHTGSDRTVSWQFRESLTALTTILNGTTPHYVRCIKPNDMKMAFAFEPHRAVQQLRACGVLETIRISAAGYPSRWTYEDFFDRYRVLIHSSRVKRKAVRETCEAVLRTHIKDSDKFQFGLRKIFFRAGQVAYMEKLRADKLTTSGVMIQKHVKGWLQRTSYCRQKQAAIKMQAWVRGFLARRLAKFLRETRAATCIQRFVRGWLAKKKYQRIRAAVVLLQKFTRGMFARCLYHEMRRHAKATILQKCYRGYLARREYKGSRKAIIYLQCCVRRMRAKRELKQLKVEARSVDHYKKLNVGLENKIISLQMKVDQLTQEAQTLHSHDAELVSARAEVKALRDQVVIFKQSANHTVELTQELERVKQEREALEIKVNELQTSLTASSAKHEEDINLWQEKINNLKEQLESEQERRRLGSQSEEVHVQDAISSERKRLMSEFEAERVHHQHTLREQTRLTQRIENMTEEHKMMSHEIGRLQALQGSMMSVASEEGSQRPSRAGSLDNIMEDVSARQITEVQLILKLKARIRELEGRQDGDTSPDIDQRSHSLEAENGALQQAELTGVSHEIVERKEALENENATLKDQLNSGQSSLEIQEKRHSRGVDGIASSQDDSLVLQFDDVGMQRAYEEMRLQIDSLMTENERLKTENMRRSSSDAEAAVNLQKHTVTEVMVDDERDAVQQITALKEANQLLQTELEAVQIQAKDITELTAKNQSLEKKLARRSGSHNVTVIDQKLQQEVTRLTVENLDLREENENLVAKLKVIVQKPQVQAPRLPADGVDGLDDKNITETKVEEDRTAAVEPQYLGMFEYAQQDEARLLRKLIVDLNPSVMADSLPGLPAYVLFMCLRYCDHIGDEMRIESLLTGLITNVKKVMQKCQTDDGVVAFWFANVCRFMQNMKQYSGEQVSGVNYSETLLSQSLKNFDLTEYRHVVSDLAVHIYQNLVKIEQDKIQPMIVPGLLEYESIPGVSHSKPFGLRNVSGKGKGRGSQSPGAEACTVNSIIKELSRVMETLSRQCIDPQLVKQIFRQIFYTIGAYMLNNLLLRKDMCHWSRGMQIRYNLTQLEEWCRHSGLQDSGAMESLCPIVQATQLLQVSKRAQSDVAAIFEMCTALNPLQIQKILTMYTPVNEFEERVPVSVIRAVVAQGADRADPSRLMMDISFMYPVTFPFVPVDVNLGSVTVPSKLKLNFLKKI